MTTKHFCLYLDESGIAENRGARSGFQLAGFWTGRPSGKRKDVVYGLDREAKRLISRMKENAGVPQEDEFHATETRSNPKMGEEVYWKACSTLIGDLPQSWQAVRIVNRTGASTGEPVLDYTLMVAQLYHHVLRVIAQQKENHSSEIRLHLVYASVLMGHDPKDSNKPIFLDDEEYLRRTQLEVIHEAVRNGKSPEESLKPLGEFCYESGAKHPPLMICDWISNSSYNRCADNKDLFAALDERLETVSFDPGEFGKRIEDLLIQGRLGEALNLLTLAEDPSADLLELRNRVLAQISGLRPRDFDSQFQPVIAQWILMVENLKDSGSLDLLGRYEEEVFPALENLAPANLKDVIASRLVPTLYSLHLYSLSAANHSGDLQRGIHHAQMLEKLAPDLAGRWDRIELLIEGMIRIGVHKTDRLLFEEARDFMERFSGFLQETGDLFGAMEGFPSRVRSDLRGKVLGTGLQATMYLGLRQSEQLDKARELNNEALAEFSDPTDKNQQYQYRCQIESFAGNFSEAIQSLATSLGCEQSSESNAESLGDLIAKMEANSFPQGFALLHWLRIGAMARFTKPSITEEVYQAVKSRKLHLNNGWFIDRDQYPAHSILRFGAIVFAHVKEWEETKKLVKRFAYLHLSDGVSLSKSSVFNLIWTATQIEVGIAAYEAGNTDFMQDMFVDSKNKKRGVIHRLGRITNQLKGEPSYAAVYRKNMELLQSAETFLQKPEDSNNRSTLSGLVREIPW